VTGRILYRRDRARNPNSHEVPCAQGEFWCQQSGNTPQTVLGDPVVAETASGRRNSLILWSAAAGVLLISLASIPLLQEREWKRVAL
jgi:hypothetical protein